MTADYNIIIYEVYVGAPWDRGPLERGARGNCPFCPLINPGLQEDTVSVKYFVDANVVFIGGIVWYINGRIYMTYMFQYLFVCEFSFYLLAGNICM